MKINDARITIMVNDTHVTIEFCDSDSNTTFAKATLTSEQFCAALSRLSRTQCEITVMGLDRVGKTMEHKKITFEIPEGTLYKKGRDIIVSKYAKKATPDGWICDDYFGSQGTFFSQDGKSFATAIIRRWI